MTSLILAPVAQLDRALDFESRGQGFESSRAHHYLYNKLASNFKLQVKASKVSSHLRNVMKLFYHIYLEAYHQHHYVETVHNP